MPIFNKLVFPQNFIFKSMPLPNFMKDRQLDQRQTDGRGIHIFTGGFNHNIWRDFEFADNWFSEIRTLCKKQINVCLQFPCFLTDLDKTR